MYLLDAGETMFFAGDTALVPDTHRLVEDTLWKNGRELDLAMALCGCPDIAAIGRDLVTP